MLHLTAGIFGNQEFAASLAKKIAKPGTVNDIAIYNHGSSEGVFTYVAVNSDKIQSLLQAINMIDVPIIAINELNAAVADQIIAISEFGFDRGFVMLENISEEQIKPLIKGTCIEKFVVVKDTAELIESLKKLNIERHASPLVIPIDNYFDVKSVGTVILGIIKSSSVKKYDKVIVEPLGKEVTIKGIQSQDKDIETAEAGMRVGLNLKGIEAEELKRGYVIGEPKDAQSIMEKSKLFKLNFTKSKYSKEQLKENDQIFICSGLQVVAARVKSISPLEVETENQIAYSKDTKFLIASTKQSIPRIIGSAHL